MVRRKKEYQGVTLDLTLMKEDTICIEDLIMDIPKASSDTEVSPLIHTSPDIGGMIEQFRKTCVACESVYYSAYTRDSHAMLCTACYRMKIASLTECVTEYLKEQGKLGCKFCGVARATISGFHLDHINMFNKKESVGEMVYALRHIDDIKAEIDKCQMLCAACHSVITEMEKRLGFTAYKTRKKVITPEISMKYDVLMGEIYAIMQKIGE